MPRHQSSTSLTSEVTTRQSKQLNSASSIAMVVRLFSPKGGLELYTHRLIEGLLNAGYKVTVFCEEQQSDLKHENLSVVRLESKPAHLKKRERLNFYYREFSRLLREHGPFDIVHTQHVAIEQADVAHFHNHTIHRVIKNGKSWERWLNRLKLQIVPSYRERDKYDRFLASNAKVLMFPSALCQRDYEDSYDLPSIRNIDSHMVAYPGADPVAGAEGLFPGTIHEHESEALSFLFVGKGFRKKGLDILLLACRQLAKKGYPFKLLIAGLEEKTGDRIRLITYGISKHVVYLGFQRDMRSVFARAKVILLPSRVEPFGMAPLEAMNYGLVPIVSKASGIAEILSDGKNACILEDHLSCTELASIMATLIEQPEKLSGLSQGLHSICKDYRWQHTVDATLKAYAKILSSRAARSEQEY